MFERKILQKLKSWKNHDHKSLVLKGQRQIGKTTIAEYFGKTEYTNYVILDIFKDPIAKRILEDNSTVDSIIDSISLYKGIDIVPKESLIIIDEIQESMAISVDLKNWADAYAWDLETENEVEIDDVRFDFDPMEIEEGDYEVTFVTEGRTYKIHTTENQEEGDIVSLDFDPEDIHVMEKSIG